MDVLKRLCEAVSLAHGRAAIALEHASGQRSSSENPRRENPMTRLLILFAAAALTFASAAESYRFTLFQESVVSGSTLKAGDYRVTIDGDKVVISQGKTKVETTGKLETVADKFNSTSVRYQNGDGKYRLKEIRLGGTSKKLVFDN
jgi:hypothetical protein